jgi:type VI secretion system protein ImpC
MPAKHPAASFDFAVRSGSQPKTTGRELGARYHIVLLGDFTGRANRDVVEPLAGRKLWQVDTDNFARTFTQLGARLKLIGNGIPDGTVEVPFSSFDDFHPDQLLAQAPALAKLAEARRLVLNPTTTEDGKAALQALLQAAVTPPTSPPATAATPVPPESDDELMARLLGGTPAAAKQSPATSSPAEQFIRQIVAPHIAPTPGAWQSSAIAAAEMELSSRLNAMLHHPDLQALEAAWRGVDLLVRRIEEPGEIGLLLLDVSPAELRAELLTRSRPEESALFRLLRDRQPSLLIGNFTFGQTADDLRALRQLAEIAARLSAPFIASAAPQLVGCDSFALHPDPDDWKLKLPADVAEVWAALRQSPHAGHVGLTAPRFMARQAYGKAGDPIETFPFEELRGEPAHESFLWGHSAVLCASAAIDARQAGDLELAEFTGGEIGDLPLHKLTEDGEIVVKPYAEVWLTDRATARMLDRGILPVVSIKNENTIRLNQLRSIATESIMLPFA